MAAGQDGQVVASAAEVYERLFVPAMFAEWAVRMAEAAALTAGERVLDVACGTGALAREAARRVGPRGSVTGVDLNPAMLAVAERVAPDLTWLQSPAEKLPLPDGAFDAVVSQFGLMFFQAREAALREMARVLRPGGRLAVAVWDAVERTDGYPELTELLRERVGEEAAHALRAPFVLGDRAELAALFEKAGMGEARIVTRQGAMRFPDLDAWIFTEIRGWVLADRLTDAQYAPLLEEARTRLARFVRRDGTVELASPAHLVTFTKPE